MVTCAGIVGDGGEVLDVGTLCERSDECFWDTAEPEPCIPSPSVHDAPSTVARHNSPPDRMVSPDLTSLSASSTESQTLVFFGRDAFATTE